MTRDLRPGSAPPVRHALTLAGVSVELCPSRALWMPALHTLVVADLHWGKAAALRASQVPVPRGTTAHDLDRLSRTLHDTAATQLVVLGDLLHARHGRGDETMRTIATWRAQHADVRITLVRGNHDVHAGDPPAALDIACVDGPFAFGPFVGVHDPDEMVAGPGYVLSGHLHPSVTVHGRGRLSARLACFVFGATRGVLPAFSSFTGGGMYARAPGDALYAIVGEEIVAL
ncbi:MAG: ligase-associated DNA damage response endonuclease PdeM [Gemmatimonadetes bacterium]|nr:ligase-associated DNA damage response endonuclease PdeM [Gemmatimonadota bacterium]